VLRIVTLALLVAVAACASGSAGGPPDATAEVDAEPCYPDPDGEQCNGVDDNCDGRIDEGYPGVGEPCEVGVGACLVAGTTVCTPDGEATECGAVAGEPGDELCGTLEDEDCDGETDEGFFDLGTPCTEGVGRCAATGVRICGPTGLTTTCSAVPGQPTNELCNGQDDDCDGDVDEDFQINQPCDGPDSDLCNEGVWACNASGGRLCTDNTGSTLDLCGNGDEDCDPSSADGSEDPAVGQPCDGPDSDFCLEGVRTCVNGNYGCTDNTSSTVELCDGTGNDEDCDGLRDEDWNRNDNPACASTLLHLGSVSGDTGAGQLSDSWMAEAWDRIRITENNDGNVYLSATIRLWSPAGTDFDLYLYCANCPGAGPVASSTVTSTTGHWDYVYPRWDDDWGASDDYNVIVEVRHKSSTLCAYWTLQVYGNTDLGGYPNTCNP
jgi:hypothetical protein